MACLTAFTSSRPAIPVAAAEANLPIAKDLRSRVLSLLQSLPPSEALTAASGLDQRLGLDGLRQAARGSGSRPSKRALL